MAKKIVVSDSLATVMIQLHVEFDKCVQVVLLTKVWTLYA